MVNDGPRGPPAARDNSLPDRQIRCVPGAALTAGRGAPKIARMTTPSLPEGVRRVGPADVPCVGEPPVPVRRVARALERAKGDVAKVSVELPGLTEPDVEAARRLIELQPAELDPRPAIATLLGLAVPLGVGATFLAPAGWTLFGLACALFVPLPEAPGSCSSGSRSRSRRCSARSGSSLPEMMRAAAPGGATARGRSVSVVAYCFLRMIPTPNALPFEACMRRFSDPTASPLASNWTTGVLSVSVSAAISAPSSSLT
jgi:hypothetical protein